MIHTMYKYSSPNHTKLNSKTVYKDEIWLADLPYKENSDVQHGYRPVLIISNDMGNTHSNVVTVVPITSNPNKIGSLPTHLTLDVDTGLMVKSVALFEQPVTIDKSQLGKRISKIPEKYFKMVDEAIRISTMRLEN